MRTREEQTFVFSTNALSATLVYYVEWSATSGKVKLRVVACGWYLQLVFIFHSSCCCWQTTKIEILFCLLVPVMWLRIAEVVVCVCVCVRRICCCCIVVIYLPLPFSSFDWPRKWNFPTWMHTAAATRVRSTQEETITNSSRQNVFMTSWSWHFCVCFAYLIWICGHRMASN